MVGRGQWMVERHRGANLWFGLVLLGVLLGLRTDGRANDATPAEDRSAGRPVVVFGSDQDFYPYEWLDESGKPHGLNIELMRALGAEMGFDARFRLGPWTEARKALEADGTIDVSDMYHSERRAHLVDFVEPYMVVWDQAWVRVDEREIRSLEDLAGLRVLVQDKAFTQEYLEEWGKAAAVIGLASEPVVLKELARGRGDVALVTQIPARQAFQRFRHDNLQPSGPPLLSRSYGLVVAKGRHELFEMLNEGMAALKRNGTMADLERKWLMEPHSPSRVLQFLERYLGWFLWGVVVFLGLGLGYAVKLTLRSRRQARELAAELVERRRVEDALRASEQKFSKSFQSSPTVMAVSRLADGRHIDVNDAWVRVFGYSREEAQGRSAVELGLYEPAERARLVEELRLAGKFHNLETQVTTRSGHSILALLNADLIDLGGETCILITMTDITEIRRWEKALQDSEARWKFALEGAGEGAWDWDVLLGQVKTSPRYREILYCRSGDEDGEAPHWLDCLHPDDEKRVRNELMTHFSRAAPLFQTEARVQDTQGEVHWVSVRGKALAWGADARPTRMIGTIADVTDRHRAEEERLALEAQLQQSQKMDIVGQLAGGIAHDFNNQLTVIRGYCELLQQEALGGRGTALLQEVVRATVRASGLTGRLLAFGRKQVRRLAVVNLNQVINDMAGSLSLMIGEGVGIEVEVAANLGNVRADRSQIEQVIANIAVNARDAMPGGGKLTIRTRNIVLDEEYVRRHVGSKVGPHVMMAFQDTGVGIAEEDMTRMFDPFFTTKGEGQGSGLGLSIVYGIVRQSGGHITVESEVGRGATFKILLPRVYESVTTEPEPPQEAPHRRDPATILFVEDDANLFSLMSGVIAGAGYHTLSSSDPVEACRIGLEYPDPIDLLVSDVVMPGMSGPQLAEALAQKRPEMRILFVSGYPKDVLDRQTVLPPGVRLLSKPFSPRDLLAEIQRILGEMPGNGGAKTSEPVVR